MGKKSAFSFDRIFANQELEICERLRELTGLEEVIGVGRPLTREAIGFVKGFVDEKSAGDDRIAQRWKQAGLQIAENANKIISARGDGWIALKVLPDAVDLHA